MFSHCLMEWFMYCVLKLRKTLKLFLVYNKIVSKEILFLCQVQLEITLFDIPCKKIDPKGVFTHANSTHALCFLIPLKQFWFCPNGIFIGLNLLHAKEVLKMTSRFWGSKTF
jgi:hypothetical protein